MIRSEATRLGTGCDCAAHTTIRDWRDSFVARFVADCKEKNNKALLAAGNGGKIGIGGLCRNARREAAPNDQDFFTSR